MKDLQRPRFLGLEEEEKGPYDLVILPIPFEMTVSWNEGTSNGPNSCIEVSSQVELYEEKKVDYLVATDAIGMCLNLSIDHVAFSSIAKFDGKFKRNLHPMEIGQIAGRAGRYENNGTFSLLKNAGKLDVKTIQNIEESKFDSIKRIYWRNTLLDFSSVENFLASLKKFPVHNFFIHKKNAADELNFRFLIYDKNIN